MPLSKDISPISREPEPEGNTSPYIDTSQKPKFVNLRNYVKSNNITPIRLELNCRKITDGTV